jgi:hypothetical protein
MMSEDTVGLALVDGVFLLLAVGLTFWFRNWVRCQQKGLDQALQELAVQRQELGRLSGRLERLCALVEARWVTPGETAPRAVPPRPETADSDSRPGARAATTRRVDTPTSAAAAAATATAPVDRGDPGANRYDRAWELLAQGQDAAEVARRVRLGVAEVELMARMLKYQQR